MKSMTGYGKGVASNGEMQLTVELKSVNHRFLDINTKIPRSFIAHEDVIRSVLSQNVSRGHVDVFINVDQLSQTPRTVTADVALALGYVQAATQLAQQTGLKNDFQVNSLMKSPDVIKVEQVEQDDEVVRQLLQEALTIAVDKLNEMRQVEGAKLIADLNAKINHVEQLLNQLQQYAPEVVVQYRQKLTQRMQEELQGVEIDQARLLNEVAFFTDKANVDEEITRLHCHIQNARDILKLTQPIGRKLDFLVQEFNREANTICSKSNNVALTNLALEIKNEIEKIREQVQNLE
ncbi:MAG: YicC family protein [Clostridia bacterium]|nr:YicC family protein [Clostridia bacterium]